MMTKEVLKYLVIPTMIFFIFGIYVQHFVSKPIPPKKLLCDKEIDGVSSVYTRVGGLACKYDKGTLIIRDQNNIVALNIE
jgi:hypothetical protein